MTTPKLSPSFFDAFKDPRFLITIGVFIAGGGVSYHRLGAVEAGQAEIKREFTVQIARVETDIIALKLRLIDVENKAQYSEVELKRRELFMTKVDEKMENIISNLARFETSIHYIETNIKQISDKIDE